MIVRRLNQLPVLSVKNEVIGVVTKGDIFYAIFRKQLGSGEGKIRREVPKVSRKK
jgi:CBS domain-containing protein